VSQPVTWNPSVSRILCILAAAMFLLAAFGVHFPVVEIVDLGLTLFALSFVI
jgi:hypothetical protein